MSTPKKTTTSAAVPPADAVALDAHWAQKMERLRQRKLAERPFRITEDEATRDAYLRKAARAQNLRHMADNDPTDNDLAASADEAAAEAKTAEEAFTNASEVLMMRSLPRPVYDALILAHPPTEQQTADGHDWNPETFAPALIAATVTDPMSVEEATELLDIWGGMDANDLFGAALSVQMVKRSDLGKG